MVRQFRKKPVVILATQWTGENAGEVNYFCPAAVVDEKTKTVKISTLEGDHTASKGDWIIRGIAGEFYPCKPDIFASTYEPV